MTENWTATARLGEKWYKCALCNAPVPESRVVWFDGHPWHRHHVPEPGRSRGVTYGAEPSLEVPNGDFETYDPTEPLVVDSWTITDDTSDNDVLVDTLSAAYQTDRKARTGDYSLLMLSLHGRDSLGPPIDYNAYWGLIQAQAADITVPDRRLYLNCWVRVDEARGRGTFYLYVNGALLDSVDTDTIDDGDFHEVGGYIQSPGTVQIRMDFRGAVRLGYTDAYSQIWVDDVALEYA